MHSPEQKKTPLGKKNLKRVKYDVSIFFQYPFYATAIIRMYFASANFANIKTKDNLE